MQNSNEYVAAHWLIATFVISFITVGFPYWQVPSSKISLSSALYGSDLLVTGTLAADARALAKARFISLSP